jgi:hypothetical protein
MPNSSMIDTIINVENSDGDDYREDSEYGGHKK